jgi:hypothetical protein
MAPSVRRAARALANLVSVFMWASAAGGTLNVISGAAGPVHLFWVLGWAWAGRTYWRWGHEAPRRS